MGDIIADGVAEDVVERVGCGDVMCLSADDDYELAFIVEAWGF